MTSGFGKEGVSSSCERHFYSHSLILCLHFSLSIAVFCGFAIPPFGSSVEWQYSRPTHCILPAATDDANSSLLCNSEEMINSDVLQNGRGGEGQRKICPYPNSIWANHLAPFSDNDRGGQRGMGLVDSTGVGHHRSFACPAYRSAG